MSKSRGPVAAVQQVRYHRNGTAGQGYCTVEFTVRWGQERKPMAAVVFTPDGALTDGRDIHGYVKLRPGVLTDVAYAVIDPSDPSAAYAGEVFMPQVAEAIDEWCADGRAFRDAV